MFITKIKRTIRAGFISFWRNGYVSLASVLVMTVTLSVLTSIMLTGALLDSTLASVTDKVDINVYFVKGANEDDIASVGKALKNLPQVAAVDYVSSDLALEQFRERHQNDELTLQALDELGTNPLGASMNIKATDPSQYATIVKFLNDTKDNSSNGSIIDRVNYTQNKQAIDALNRIILASSRLGGAVIIFFIVVSILITFNTIRLAIYIFREEISVMRLVGASEMYIRGPFVTVGIMYGVVSGILTLILLYPITYWAGPITESIGTGLNIFAYFLHNFAYLALVVIGTGVLLGVISSYLAVRKYLRA